MRSWRSAACTPTGARTLPWSAAVSYLAVACSASASCPPLLWMWYRSWLSRVRCMSNRSIKIFSQDAVRQQPACCGLPLWVQGPRAKKGPALRRYYTQRRLLRASKKLGIPDLAVRDQLEDRRVGLRMVVFTGPIHDLGGGVQARPHVGCCRVSETVSKACAWSCSLGPCTTGRRRCRCDPTCINAKLTGSSVEPERPGGALRSRALRNTEPASSHASLDKAGPFAWVLGVCPKA